MNSRFWENQFVPLAVLLGIALIIAAAIGSWAAVAIKNASNTLSVTGSAQVAVSADSVKWVVTATRYADESGVAYASAEVTSDAKTIAAYYGKAGISADNITLGAIHTNQDYSYSQDASAPKRYIITQDVTMTSNDPALVQKLAQDTSALTNQGVALNSSDPEYYVSTLPDIRVSLMGDAVKDAKARAGEIVKSTGQSVGRLQSASSGVVQVLAANSVDVSDYGTYDTSTIDKTVMVTVRATFFVN